MSKVVEWIAPRCEALPARIVACVRVRKSE